MSKLKTAKNKNASRREAPVLHTVWLEDADGNAVGIALTDNEYKRATARAKRNPEDMPKVRKCGLLRRIVHAIEEGL